MQVSASPHIQDDVTSAERAGGDWWLSALCAETDPEAFFPERGASTTTAKAVCALCTVRAECLEYAIENDERFGIWGGTSENERRQLRRSRRPAARESAGSLSTLPGVRPLSRLTAAPDAERPVTTTPAAVLTRETV
jgi:WhiB family transcriptional regulator, redox-sensing transcriptional regulator